MLKRKSYGIAALIVNTVIFRGGRSSGTLGRRILSVDFAKPLEPMGAHLVHSASIFSLSCQILPQQSLFFARILYEKIPACLKSFVLTS